MERVKGIEPLPDALRANRPFISLTRVRLQNFKKLERVKGIEPSWPAWKAGALPLSYTRSVGMDGFLA